MSKLDELIKKLCPNGVEYKRIDKICTISRGRVMSKEYIKDNEGIYPVYSSQTENDGELGKISTYDYEGEYLTWTTDGANAGSVFYRKGKFSITNVCGLLKVNKDNILPRYLYHSLKIETPKYVNKGMGNPKLMSNVMATIRLAVPPLEVQREIVRILDSFTLLTAELTAELTARKKQYEYYRDELLKPKKTIPLVTLKEIATSIYRGSGIKREQITESGIPCVRYGEIYTTYNTWFDKCVSHTQEECVSNPKYFEHGDILFAITGESVEDIAKSIAYVGNEKCMAGGDIVVMKHQQNPRYLSHVLNTSFAREQKSKGKVKSKVVHSNVPSIEQIKIPLPSLEVQKRYADVLDNFEQICNDLNIGLPAEIEARKKQYEYYRDLLLTFAETGNIIATDSGQRTAVIKLVQYVFGYAPVKIKDVYTKIKGTPITAGKMREIEDKNGDITIYAGGKTVVSAYEEDIQNANITRVPAVLIQSRGIIDVVFCDKPFTFKNEMWAYTHKNEICVKYLYYVMKNNIQKFRELASGMGSLPQISNSATEEFVILLPTLEEQEKIVSILDRFDSLCNDISAGLPAEIEARKKQYEYYRDKLLSFE